MTTTEIEANPGTLTLAENLRRMADFLDEEPLLATRLAAVSASGGIFHYATRPGELDDLRAHVPDERMTPHLMGAKYDGFQVPFGPRLSLTVYALAITRCASCGEVQK